MFYTVTLNAAQCMRDSHNFGSTIYYNICDGTNHLVPWGFMDYVGPILAIAVVSVVVLTISAMAVVAACETRN